MTEDISMSEADVSMIVEAVKPLYFMFGVVTGLLVMSLFKGRWFV